MKERLLTWPTREFVRRGPVRADKFVEIERLVTGAQTGAPVRSRALTIHDKRRFDHPFEVDGPWHSCMPVKEARRVRLIARQAPEAQTGEPEVSHA